MRELGDRLPLGVSATDLLAHVVRVGPFPRERQVEAQLAALERERQGAQNLGTVACVGTAGRERIII
jgi:hypothetical protein